MPGRGPCSPTLEFDSSVGNCCNFFPGVLRGIGAFYVGVRINVSGELKNLEMVGGRLAFLHNTQRVTSASNQTHYDSSELLLPGQGEKKKQFKNSF